MKTFMAQTNVSLTFCLSKKTEFAAASEAFIQTIIGSLEHINASLSSNVSLADFQIGATSYDFLVKSGHLSLSSRLYSVEWHHESPQSCKILKLFLSTLDERNSVGPFAPWHHSRQAWNRQRRRRTLRPSAAAPCKASS